MAGFLAAAFLAAGFLAAGFFGAAFFTAFFTAFLAAGLATFLTAFFGAAFLPPPICVAHATHAQLLSACVVSAGSLLQVPAPSRHPPSWWQ